METLAASLRAVRDAVSETLVPRESFDRLVDLGAELPPIHCAGFEVRLGDGHGPVDLIQRVRTLAGEPARLVRHLEAGAPARGAEWSRLRAFFAELSEPTAMLRSRVAGAFLELDEEVEGRPAALPSVYLSLDPGAARDAGALESILDRAGLLLRGERLPAGVVSGVRDCHTALPDGAAITDVGLMLARDVEGVRLVVAPLARADFAAFIERLRWQGSAPPVDVLELVPETIAHVGVSLDVGERVYPRVGLEFYPGPHDDDLPAWCEALERLVGAGLCTPAKTAALLEWPGYLEPTSVPAWPDSLLVESLLNRQDRFCVLARRLTFVKLVCRPDRPLEAKAYFGYGPRSFVSRRNDGGREAIPAAAPGDGRGAAISLASTTTDSAAARDADALRAACAGARGRAVAYLLQHRDPRGMWREFPRILEGTDEWITAYVGAALATTDGDDARAAALDAWRALGDCRAADEGWGYNGGLPADADSTIWCLRLAAELGVEGAPRSDAARAVLATHLTPDGGVATYAPAAEAGLRALLGDADLGGMFVAHTCVTAAAASIAATATRVRPFLIAKQEGDGRWRGYWWSDDEYTTALAVSGLVDAGTQAAAAVDRAHGWARGRFDRSGAVWSRSLGAASPFATALCVEILLHAGSPVDLEAIAALAWLLAGQGDDGAWQPSALMRMPPGDAGDGDARPAATAVSLDDRSLFTTATVVRTLTTALRTL